MYNINNKKSYKGKKREIQSYFYNKSPTISNIVGLGGNDLNLHIEDFESITNQKSKIYIYDLNKNVINKFKYLSKLDNRIKLINSNISKCKIERFIDLDLMCSLNTSLGLILDILIKQWKKYNSYINYYKTFMFTYAHRGNTINIDDVLKLMKIILNNKISDVEIIKYKDTSLMYTVQIIWK